MVHQGTHTCGGADLSTRWEICDFEQEFDTCYTEKLGWPVTTVFFAFQLNGDSFRMVALSVLVGVKNDFPLLSRDTRIATPKDAAKTMAPKMDVRTMTKVGILSYVVVRDRLSAKGLTMQASLGIVHFVKTPKNPQKTKCSYPHSCDAQSSCSMDSVDRLESHNHEGPYGRKSSRHWITPRSSQVSNSRSRFHNLWILPDEMRWSRMQR